MRHALIKTDTTEDTGDRRDFGGDTPPDLAHKTPPHKWVPVNDRGSRPAFDKDTHARPKPGADTVAADGITETWADPVALTQPQIDAEVRDRELSDECEALKPVYRKLKNGEATPRQVQRVLAWLLRREGLDQVDPPPPLEPEI